MNLTRRSSPCRLRRPAPVDARLASCCRPSHSKRRAKAVIYLHQYGGPSQYETRHEADAPAEVRDLLPIASSLKGFRFARNCRGWRS
jgi:hypothetical protein